MIEKWRVIDESGATHEVDVTSDDSAHRLWALDAEGRPCAWPVVEGK
jgi:hypothetical protein